MCADWDHAHIAKLPRKEDVYDMEDLVKIMNTSTKRSSYGVQKEVMWLSLNEFCDWPNNILTKNMLPLPAYVDQVQFTREEQSIFIKKDIESDEIPVYVQKKMQVKRCMCSPRM